MVQLTNKVIVMTRTIGRISRTVVLAEFVYISQGKLVIRFDIPLFVVGCWEGGG